MKDDITIEMICPFCRKTHSVKVDLMAFFDWQEGALAQDAFPNLSPSEREQLISKICPDCQKSIFGD